jgi:hypothetical protein
MVGFRRFARDLQPGDVIYFGDGWRYVEATEPHRDGSLRITLSVDDRPAPRRLFRRRKYRFAATERVEVRP